MNSFRRLVGEQVPIGTYSFTVAPVPEGLRKVHSSRVRIRGTSRAPRSKSTSHTIHSSFHSYYASFKNLPVRSSIVPSSCAIAHSPGSSKHSQGKFSTRAGGTLHHAAFFSRSTRTNIYQRSLVVQQTYRMKCILTTSASTHRRYCCAVSERGHANISIHR